MRILTTAQLIDGKKIAQDIRKELRIEVDEWIKSGHRQPSLVAILVGDDAASQKYVKNKMLAAQEIGINSRTEHLSASTSEADIIEKIEKLNENPYVDGILVQLPVPEGVSERNVCNAVHPNKDVDGFHILNIGKLTLNMDTFVPATTLGVIELIKRSQISTRGKNIVICGRSKNVGLPIMMLLHSDAKYELPGGEATVIFCHRNTPKTELEHFAKRADIIISATGVVNLITPEMIKPGAVIIDVGLISILTPDGKQKLVGDVDFEGCKKVAGLITPVPGGVGPMTVAMLMKNTLRAAALRVESESKLLLNKKF